VAQTCFFVDRHLSSWERFLAENAWDPTALGQTLLDTLRLKLGASLQVHGAYRGVVDTLLIAKNGRQMLGVQTWHDHSGNATEARWGPSLGHLGLAASARMGRYLCFPNMQLISTTQSSLFIVDPAGVATLATIWDSVHPLIYRLHQSLNQAALRVVVDAYFSKAPFVNLLRQQDIHVISRLGHDAVG
jgi:hypothetical protein